ncbi:MAG: DUF1292 domain-containing protein [Oscillospiraceae bacterium]|nr:DUF1292 domain-containing protein [Oscillospiraceae bacterium]
MEDQEILVLSDEMGGEAEFEILDLIDYEDKQYAVLLPLDENDTGIVILEMTVIDEENADYADVEDEDVLNAVFEIFKEEHKDEFDFAD